MSKELVWNRKNEEEEFAQLEIDPRQLCHYWWCIALNEDMRAISSPDWPPYALDNERILVLHHLYSGVFRT